MIKKVVKLTTFLGAFNILYNTPYFYNWLSSYYFPSLPSPLIATSFLLPSSLIPPPSFILPHPSSLARPSSSELSLPSSSFALVVGGSSGIGREFAIQLAEKGFNILVIGRNKERMVQVKEEIENKFKGIRVEPIVFDLSDFSNFQFRHLVHHLATYPITLLVNNAAFFDGTSFKNLTFDTIKETIYTNCLAPTLISKFIIEKMLLSSKKDPNHFPENSSQNITQNKLNFEGNEKIEQSSIIKNEINLNNEASSTTTESLARNSKVSINSETQKNNVSKCGLINVGSQYVDLFYSSEANLYFASKAYSNAFFRAVSTEIDKKTLASCVILPGLLRTPMYSKFKEGSKIKEETFKEGLLLENPDYFVKKSLEMVEKGEKEVYGTERHALLYGIRKLGKRLSEMILG